MLELIRSRFRLASMGLALFAACGSESGAATASAAIDGAFQPALRAIEAAIERGETPGAVLLVGRGDEVLLREAIGQRALQPEPDPMTVDTLFDLASLTKPVATAASVMVLVERGEVRLDAPVAEYLPEFGARGKHGVTVEQLLRHTGGLIADNALSDYEAGPEEAWRRICELELLSPPGDAFRYTDVGYIVLAELIRRVDGRPLDEFARAELFGPLGMNDAVFLPSRELAERAAPTQQRLRSSGDSHWMRGEVHDPRAFALGGVAGHAGLFATADDLARWCRMLLNGGELDGARVLSEATIERMLRPAWLANGTNGRALGLDVDTAYSSARGAVFPRGASFGHTGFTGTSLWIDPETGSYVILLTNRVHPDGKGKVVGLRREVATLVGRVLRGAPPAPSVLTGIDVLERDDFAALAGMRVGLITNTSGRNAAGERTVDVLARAPQLTLVSVLTPEHGFDAALEGAVPDGVDAATGLPIHSLYGETRAPTAEMLAGLDALVFDVQDAGARFYTYMSTLALAMQAAGEHGLRLFVLDRPNPIGPVPPAGPLADADRLSFIACQPIPIVHGMTLGELGRLFRGQFGVECALEVVPCEGWRRGMWWDETGLAWVDPSPNLRNPTQALLYPALGLTEFANVSVGRGTDEPFERLGAPWIDGRRLAAALNAMALPGLSCVPIDFTPESSKHAGELCGGVHFVVTDRDALRPVEAGLAVIWQLNRLFGSDYEVARVDDLMRNRAAWEALLTCSDPRALPNEWARELEAFLERRAPYLLYD